MSVLHTQKSRILIRSQRAFRESNPPGCDFPPLVLRGWGDWDCRGQLSLLCSGNNATVPPLLLSSPPLVISSYLTFLDILMKVWVRASWPCRHGKSFAIWRPVILGVCGWVGGWGREGSVPGVMLLHMHLKIKQVKCKKISAIDQIPRLNSTFAGFFFNTKENKSSTI